MVGLRLVMGSWKIIETVSPRKRRISASVALVTSWPSSQISPSVILPILLGNSRMIERAMVVFPAPVSPTTPRVSPLSMERSSPLTA